MNQRKGGQKREKDGIRQRRMLSWFHLADVCGASMSGGEHGKRKVACEREKYERIKDEGRHTEGLDYRCSLNDLIRHAGFLEKSSE